MGKRILIGCFEVPGYGGASTATYKLFELMQKDGIDVHYVNLITVKDSVYFKHIFGQHWGNPKCLSHVHNCHIKGSFFESQPEISSLVSMLSPDVLVGVGHIATILLKHASPDKKVIYMTSGCEQAKTYITKRLAKDVNTLQTMLASRGDPAPVIFSQEKDAIACSDLIIMHSDMIQDLLRSFFPSHRRKMHSATIWFAEWIYKDASDYDDLKQPFSKRDIDVLFIASTWKRPEKNFDLVKKIVSRSKDLKIHIVGEMERKVARAKCWGIIRRRDQLFGLMGRAKTVVSPSRYDSAPGILYEASAMGCNIVTSKNCGNWQICHDRLLVESYDAESFLKKIPISLQEKFEDHIDRFLETKSYRNLIRILAGNTVGPETFKKGITAVVLTLGESTYQRAVDSLKRQTLMPDEVITVRNKAPFHKALNFGTSQVKTEFFMQVDSDMVLDETCLEDLKACMDPDTGLVVGHLRDPLMGRVSSIKLFRTGCFENIPFKNTISPDTDFREDIARYGWTTVYALNYRGGDKAFWHTFGEHRPSYTPHYTYAKYLLEGRRYGYRKDFDGLRWHFDVLGKSRHRVAFIAQIAMAHGIFLKEREDLLKPYSMDRDFRFLESFIRDKGNVDIDKTKVRELELNTRRGIFKHYYRLGMRFRRERAFRSFHRCILLLDKRGDTNALISKIGLCHGLFIEVYDRKSFSHDYALLKKMMPDKRYAIKVKSRLKVIFCKFRHFRSL